VFVTRAARHDRAEIERFLSQERWPEADLDHGTTFIARDEAVVGCVRLIEVESRVFVMDDTLVRSDRRGEGIGTRLLQAAMKSTGGTIFVDSNPRAVTAYERAGFRRVPFEDFPPSVVAYYESIGDLPFANPDEHVHLRAR
jgi:GNAT superfamily N-acetyltransferase